MNQKLVVLMVVSIFLGWILPSFLPVNGHSDGLQKIAILLDDIKGKSSNLLDQIKKR